MNVSPYKISLTANPKKETPGHVTHQVSIFSLLDAATSRKPQNRCAHEFDRGGEKRNQNAGSDAETQGSKIHWYCRVSEMRCKIYDSIKVCAHKKISLALTNL